MAQTADKLFCLASIDSLSHLFFQARPVIRTYFVNSTALIFVIDSAAQERLPEVKNYILSTLSESHLEGLPLLVLANKQDLPGALAAEEIEAKLALPKGARPIKFLAVSALTGAGLDQALEWLASFF